MPSKKRKSRLRRILVFPFVLLLILLILIYNPVSVRLMTVGTAVFYGIEPPIFYRLIETESHFRSFAVSPSAAIGLGQVKESTAKYIHTKHKRGMLFVPFYNLRMSAQYIRYLQKRFDNNWTLVLAAYNWGENNVETRMRRTKINPKTDYRQRFSDIPETYNFINRILPKEKKLDI
jgi:soluble lytic murein transglycosylase-like protein